MKKKQIQQNNSYIYIYVKLIHQVILFEMNNLENYFQLKYSYQIPF